MSMHRIPLTPLEEAGLKAHHLEIGVPSQLSDVFRQGVAWAKIGLDEALNEVERLKSDGLNKIMAMTDKQINAWCRMEGHHPDDQATILKQSFEIVSLKVENKTLLTRIHQFDKHVSAVGHHVKAVCGGVDVDPSVEGSTAQVLNTRFDELEGALKLAHQQLQYFLDCGFIGAEQTAKNLKVIKKALRED